MKWPQQTSKMPMVNIIWVTELFHKYIYIDAELIFYTKIIVS